MSFRRAACDPATGRLPDGARSAWKALHKSFKVAKRDAVREAELAAVRSRLEDGKADPRGLWAWLRGGDKAPCAIEDLGRWTAHFSTVLNGEGGGAAGDAGLWASPD